MLSAMSNDDTPPAFPARPDGSDDDLGSLAQPPTEAMPTVPEPGTRPTDPGPGAQPSDSTQAIPVVPIPPPNDATTAMTGPGEPPPPSGSPTGQTGPTPPGSPQPASPQTSVTPLPAAASQPWYKQPGPLAGIVLGVLAVGVIIALLVFAVGGDDDADGGLGDLSGEPVTLAVVRNDSGGSGRATTLTAAVESQPTPVDYTWVVPQDAVPGETADRATDATGRAEFRWVATEDVDLSAWTSTVTITEALAGGVSGVDGECTLERDGESEPLVVDVDVTGDDNSEPVANYTFPNQRFAGGDEISCGFTDVAADVVTPVTEVPITEVESSSSVPETATTETTTTVPETTTTESTTTTTTSTTTTTTTTMPTTVPPPSAPTLTESLRSQPNLSESLQLLDRVGLLTELERSEDPFTLFAPDNAAIQALRDGENPPDLSDDAVVRDLLLAHVSFGDALTGQQVLGSARIDVANGGPQLIDADASPPTIGGAPLIALDIEVDGGVVHLIGAALTPQ